MGGYAIRAAESRDERKTKLDDTKIIASRIDREEPVSSASFSTANLSTHLEPRYNVSISAVGSPSGRASSTISHSCSCPRQLTWDDGSSRRLCKSKIAAQGGQELQAQRKEAQLGLAHQADKNSKIAFQHALVVEQYRLYERLKKCNTKVLRRYPNKCATCG